MAHKQTGKHPGGRPRTVSSSPNEMVKLGEEMIKWVNLNKPLHLSEWYTVKKMFTYNQWDTMTKRAEFVPYYEKALKIVAKNYINGTIPPAIAQRFLRLYFKDMKDQEDIDANAEVLRKKEIEGAKPTQIIVKVTNDGLGSGLNVSAERLSDPHHQSSQ